MGTKHIDYTVDHIKTVITMWNTNTMAEISKATGLQDARIRFLAKQIRKAGYELPYKFTMPKNNLKNIIGEILAERKK